MLPAEWILGIDTTSLRELPTEFIGERGDKRIADLCWLAEGSGTGSMILLIENQSDPDWRMAARALSRIGLLYESLGAAARGPDGLFPPTLLMVVYTRIHPWPMPDDLTGLVRVEEISPLAGLAARIFARLDLRDLAAQ